ncbi:MAG: hypothetical protein K2L26_04985, partial [Duncaniella sp.]|nr:hypothetical protein [Duncaniella sp.]
MTAPKTTHDLSISEGFIATHPTAADLHRRMAKRPHSAADTAKALDGLPFAVAYDILRLAAREAVEKGETQRAIEAMSGLELHISGLPEAEEGRTLDIRAALMQVITALYIADGKLNSGAAAAAAATLHLLARTPKRKDAAFIE